MFRFAPSPTGDMHLGNLRVALFNYVMAKKMGEKYIVRIEDTDKERNIEGKDIEILEMLELFGIKYDELYYQSHNIKFHQQFAAKLLMEKKAFCCFCTENDLEQKREAAIANNQPYRYDGACENLSDEYVLNNENHFTVRLKKPKDAVAFFDEIKGNFSFEPCDIDSFVLLRADKTPTYNFACASDDMLHNVGYVIRGEDHVSNTPKQIHIRKSLGYEKEIKYAHLPIILGEEGKKMSKRDAASSIKWLLEQGILPQAITNYLLLMGNKTPKDVFTIDEAMEWFEIKNISKSPAKFSFDMLRHLNREHIRMYDSFELAKKIGFHGAEFGELAKIYTEESSSIFEIQDKIKAIFEPKTPPCEFEKEFETVCSIIKEAPYFAQYDDFKNFVQEKSGLKGKPLFKCLRVALSGAEHGPDLKILYPHIKDYIVQIVQSR